MNRAAPLAPPGRRLLAPPSASHLRSSPSSSPRPPGRRVLLLPALCRKRFSISTSQSSWSASGYGDGWWPLGPSHILRLSINRCDIGDQRTVATSQPPVTCAWIGVSTRSVCVVFTSVCSGMRALASTCWLCHCSRSLASRIENSQRNPDLLYGFAAFAAAPAVCQSFLHCGDSFGVDVEYRHYGIESSRSATTRCKTSSSSTVGGKPWASRSVLRVTASAIFCSVSAVVATDIAVHPRARSNHFICSFVTQRKPAT